ncbi:unnamed protein product [Sphenostylis stenocarpa]|uniref:LRRCT domain-containing protein n=1 Tax=Sphenostylis stenocarpa TaxID=92480 RepID=A0AA86VX17_9FABA|nr:unnamed protein product [Sphenostylis stenocarpa]
MRLPIRADPDAAKIWERHRQWTVVVTGWGGCTLIAPSKQHAKERRELAPQKRQRVKNSIIVKLEQLEIRIDRETPITARAPMSLPTPLTSSVRPWIPHEVPPHSLTYILRGLEGPLTRLDPVSINNSEVESMWHLNMTTDKTMVGISLSLPHDIGMICSIGPRDNLDSTEVLLVKLGSFALVKLWVTFALVWVELIITCMPMAEEGHKTSRLNGKQIAVDLTMRWFSPAEVAHKPSTLNGKQKEVDQAVRWFSRAEMAHKRSRLHGKQIAVDPAVRCFSPAEMAHKRSRLHGKQIAVDPAVRCFSPAEMAHKRSRVHGKQIAVDPAVRCFSPAEMAHERSRVHGKQIAVDLRVGRLTLQNWYHTSSTTDPSTSDPSSGSMGPLRRVVIPVYPGFSSNHKTPRYLADFINFSLLWWQIRL